MGDLSADRSSDRSSARRAAQGAKARSAISLADLIRTAGSGVRLHRLRSLLTVSSFAAGTAAAVALLAVTGGARVEILRQIQALGSDLVSVRTLGSTGGGQAPPLTLADAEALRSSFEFVREVAPVRSVDSSVLLPERRVAVEVVGTTPDYFALRRLRFVRGRSFTTEETTAGRNTCVLGGETARRLAGGRDAYGSLVRVGDSWCRVVGVLAAGAASARHLELQSEEAGRELYLPIGATLRRDLSERQALGGIWLRVAEGIDPEAAARAVRRSLLRRHDGAERFQIATAEALLREQRRARGLLDVLLASVAVLAFALGGVGLASLSWQSVATRSREIAIRRAVGARQGEILAQFVLEAVVLAAIGSAVGVVVGALGSGLAARLAGWPWLLPVAQVAAVGSLALAIGVLASLYPAYLAARLDPVPALRVER